jgi:phytoene dehydrogenase-like protein
MVLLKRFCNAGFDRFKHKSPLKNLYFVGAWTFPGGGFEGAIRTANKLEKQI